MKKSLIITVLFATLFFTDKAFTKILVVSIKGDVAYKKGRQWKSLKKGQRLSEGTKISTGVRSSAIIKIDDNTLKVKQLTMMKIYRNTKTAKSRYTHLGLKRGSLNARIKRIGRLKTSFKITTPVATSSVRGTEEVVSYGPKTGMTIKVIEGSVQGENLYGINNTIKGRYTFRLRPDESRPENLLCDVRDASIISLYNDITKDERGFHELYGEEIVDNSESAVGHLSNVGYYSSFTSGNANVSVSLQWPDEKVK
ncbi:MAG: FecR domain-containing protein [Spirochaetota bacterium]|nr:FecR domain-containing protein [Spirochaetota bacterium]